MIRVISWNVNGIRAILRKGFLESLKRFEADIVCLQETRALPQDINLSLTEYFQYWNPAEKKGYAGTAVLSRIKPLCVKKGLEPYLEDREGRVLTLEYEHFFLVNVYTPNAKRDLSRLPYRFQEWDRAFLKYLQRLEAKKPVIFCGDLNVAHREIDLAHPESNRGNHGFTDEEREGFENFIKAGFLDTFREFCQEGGHYTWWPQWGNCRERNIGWRIDYFLISPKLRKALKNAFILPDVKGSDHCPVGIDLLVDGKKV